MIEKCRQKYYNCPCCPHHDRSNVELVDENHELRADMNYQKNMNKELKSGIEYYKGIIQTMESSFRFTVERYERGVEELRDDLHELSQENEYLKEMLGEERDFESMMKNMKVKK